MVIGLGMFFRLDLFCLVGEEGTMREFCSVLIRVFIFW